MTDGQAEFVFSQENIERLKQKYSVEMKDAQENPIRICMRLVFEAAIQKDPKKRLELSLELSEFLTKSDGLVNLFLALIDFDESSQKTTNFSQRFMAVAQIITCLPKLSTTYEQYCDNISRQLLPLLLHRIDKYATLASIIIKSLIDSPHAKKQPNKITDIVLKPITQPLLVNNQDNRLRISDSILAIHNLVQNHLQASLFLGSFSNLLYGLINLYETPSRMKSYLKTILIDILNDLKPGPACCLLEKAIFQDSKRCNIYQVVVEEDEITIEISKSNKFNFDTLEEVVIDLLENCHNDLLILEFFFHFQAAMWTNSNEEQKSHCASLINPLLAQTIEERPNSKLDLLSSIITNGQRAIELISRTLINYIECLRRDLDGSFQNSAHESIGYCVSILEVLLLKHTEDDIACQRILQTLSEIKKTLLESGNQKGSKSKLIQNLNSFLQKIKKESRLVEIEDDYKAQKECENVMKDLNDKLVPVRVHALVRLKQLIMANDKFTISKIPHLITLVESTLAETEPYVFLASIGLLAEMSLRKTSDILPKLIELHSRQDLSLQQRLNVGEVLVRLTKQLNKTTPFYAQQMLGALLANTSDVEELMRASSLVNIGFICSDLGDTLGKFVLDILLCIERVLTYDTIQVKCAAIDLLRTTLLGLDKHNVESIQRELRSMYNLLKNLKRKTLDEKLCLQVDLALEEIGRLAKEILGHQKEQESRLVKNIKVLSLLD